jgi:hypothetical protein
MGRRDPARRLLRRDLIGANLGPLRKPRIDAASFPPVNQSLEFDNFLPDPTDTLRDAVRVGRRGISHTARIFLSRTMLSFSASAYPRRRPDSGRRQHVKHRLFMRKASATLSV